MKSFLVACLFIGITACLANPLPDGNVGIDVKKENNNPATANVFGSHTWETDRSQLGISGNHQRELGGLNRHQTNAGISGSHDVFRSNDGRTRGTVYGDFNRQWDSSRGVSNSRTVGGRVEHTWG